MLRDKLYFEDLNFRFESLICYGNLRLDPVLCSLDKMARAIACDSESMDITVSYYDFIRTLIEESELLGLSGNIFQKYLLHIFLNDVNFFTLAAEKGINVKETSLYEMALKDINILMFYMDLDLNNLTENVGYKEKILEYVPCEANENPYLEELAHKKTADELLDSLIWYHNRFGCGEFAELPMYKFDTKRGIIGVKNYDRISFSDLIGYKEQKDKLINNTEAFLNGHEANNVLLVGSRGTGKSSCVKALANEYYEQGLRLIEVSKDQLIHLSEILNVLKGRGKHFIIFIDDLSFEDFETQYKYMKSVLEGSVETRPNNVLFYATSNRRHIVKENWDDKSGTVVDNGEIHASDTVNEKLSLSDRFGLTITFPKPSPKEYQDIVIGLAQKKDLCLDEDFLKKQAMNWELNQKGLSGRTAKQFIQYIIWELKKE